jgi:hypothetical protein
MAAPKASSHKQFRKITYPDSGHSLGQEPGRLVEGCFAIKNT